MKRLILTITLLLSYSLQAGMFVGLDVRTIEEVLENPAPNSIHISLKELSFRVEDKIKQKDTEIYVFCEGGVRAQKALNILKNLGYSRVLNIGSWRDWNKLKRAK